MAKKSRNRRSPRKRSRSRSRRGGRLARTLAKAVVPFGLLMTQKQMQKRKGRKGRKGRKTRRR
ncbi:MAG: hypothetical protein ACXABD_04920 [Candidatus Thorarchaeota archaeon]